MFLLENSWMTRQTEPRWSLCGWSLLATRRPCTVYFRQGICGIAPCQGFQVCKLAKPQQMTLFSIGPPISHLEYLGPELAATTIYQMCMKSMRSIDIVGSCQDLGCTLCITTGHKIGELASFQSGTGPAQEHSGEFLRRRHQFHFLIQFDHSITGKIQQWWSCRELTCVVLVSNFQLHLLPDEMGGQAGHYQRKDHKGRIPYHKYRSNLLLRAPTARTACLGMELPKATHYNY